MKIKELISSVAALVAERDTIDHGSIRCLFSDVAVDSISSVDDCDEVGTGTVGDYDLAEKLAELAEEGIGEIDYDDLSKLETAYLGDEISDYLDPEAENELRKLDRLIEAAKVLVE